MGWHKGVPIDRRRWAKVRLACLDRDNWTCKRCSHYGHQADHIVALVNDPDQDPYDLTGLQCLCSKCHKVKTNEDMGRAPPDPEQQKWRRYLADLARTIPT